MRGLSEIVKMNLSTLETAKHSVNNPDRMGFDICSVLDEKTMEIREIVNTMQGMSPIDSDHNGEATLSVLRKLKVAALTLSVHMKIGGEDLEFLKDLEVELRDMAHEVNAQVDTLENKIKNLNEIKELEDALGSE